MINESAVFGIWKFIRCRDHRGIVQPVLGNLGLFRALLSLARTSMVGGVAGGNGHSRLAVYLTGHCGQRRVSLAGTQGKTGWPDLTLAGNHSLALYRRDCAFGIMGPTPRQSHGWCCRGPVNKNGQGRSLA